MNNFVSSAKKWISNHKIEFVLLMIVLTIGAFMRLHRIGEYMTFLGDEGRDAIVVRRLLVDLDPILVGPGTSIGNMYLGPLYYYFITPGLLLANFSPVGPSIQIALFSVLTIAMVWFIGREWFPAKGKGVAWGGIIAALLYAISPTVIIFSRSSWNPNIMPFLALVSVYAIWRVWKYLEYKWLIVLGVSFAFVLQSHYIGLVLLPLLAIFYLLALVNVRKDKTQRNKLFRFTFYGSLIFVFLMSPLVIFDARHGWRNVDAIWTFFTERQTTVSARPWSALPNAWPLLQQFMTRLVGGRNEHAGAWIAVGIVGAVLGVITLYKKKAISQSVFQAFAVLFVWLGVSVIGLGIYKQHIYDHYFGFFFPVPFLIIGGVFQLLLNRAFIRGWWIVGTAMVYLLYFNFVDSPLRYQPNRQLQRTEAIAQFVNEQSMGELFNFAVIAERNYEAAYQYFLERNNAPLIHIDPQNSEATIADQLIVVCELENKDECDPTHNAKSEIANFGWSEIETQWDLEGVRIYKLVHTKPTNEEVLQ